MKNSSKFIDFLEWDSEFFDKKTGRVFGDKVVDENTWSEFYDEIVSSGFEQVYYFQDCKNTENVTFLVEKGLVFIDTQIVLDKRLNNLNDVGVEVEDLVQKKISSELVSQMESLANDLAVKSRFYRDTKVDKRMVKMMYKNWISNSLSGEIADWVFGLKIENQIVGFASFKKVEKAKASLELMMVDKGRRAEGLGSKLLNSSLLNLKKIEIANVVVETQISNSIALRFYEKLGFQTQNTKYIFHWHGGR